MNKFKKVISSSLKGMNIIKIDALNAIADLSK